MPTINFEQFKHSKLRTHWIAEPGISIYVRKSVRMGIDFDLANFETDVPGSGSLTRFLDKYEPLHIFYVECIHNERLAAYLLRRGYTQVDPRDGLETNMRGPTPLNKAPG